MRSLAGILALVLSGVAAAGCTSAPTCPTDGTYGTDNNGVQVISIHVGSHPDGTMYMTPGTMCAHKGSNVRFVVINDDSIFHDVALISYGGTNIEHEVNPHSTVSTHHDGNDYFVASATGQFQVICEVAGHADKGMKGTFTVS